MTTLGEIINEVSKIRGMLDSVEVKGYENRRRLNIAYEGCTSLINAINQAAQEIQNEGKQETNTEGDA